MLLLGLIAGLFLVAAARAPYSRAAEPDVADEIVFYRDDGLFRYYDIDSTGSLPRPIYAGDNYTTGWTSITGVDLDGRGQDEILFYRDDGLFRFYNIDESGHVGSPIRAGDSYTAGWDAITGIDLDGDGQDELFFYRDDGLFRYYNVHADGTLGSPIAAGSSYTPGWDVIAAIDLDGDGKDELFFYRDDGVYSYYDVSEGGSLGSLILSGSNYTPGWTSVVPIDLDGDWQDEMLFYKDTGLYRYYDVSANGSVGSPLRSGDEYTSGWSVIASVSLQGDLPEERISRFTTFFDCCQNRVTNIRLMAREVNGTVLQPGETFSIDEVVGPRTSAGGYLPAPYLQNGHGECCAVGGGVSQFGTTIHNAVFWGGLEVVSHRPHTGWISRYPLGIEATLVYHSIDYKFTNNTTTPLTIRTSSTGTSVTVELWGNQGGWQMSGYHPRGARSSRVTVLDSGGPHAKRVSAAVYGSAPGTVRVVRTLTQNGVRKAQTWYWRYVS